MENAVNITIPMTIPTIAPAGSFVAPSATSGALGSPTKLIIKLYIKLLLTCNLFKGQLQMYIRPLQQNPLSVWVKVVCLVSLLGS